MAQVEAALVIALVLEARREHPEDVDDAEFLADVRERCERLLVELGDKYQQAMVKLGLAQLEGKCGRGSVRSCCPDACGGQRVGVV